MRAVLFFLPSVYSGYASSTNASYSAPYASAPSLPRFEGALLTYRSSGFLEPRSL